MDNQTINIGATLKIPVALLGSDYKELLQSLTVDNPEYKNARFFSKGFVKKSIAPKLHFFLVNDRDRTISVPRNIDMKYYKGVKNIIYSFSEGSQIVDGGDPLPRPHQNVFLSTKVYPYIHDKESNNSQAIDMLLNAECGSGKTFLALHIANYFKRKTIVCVTTKKIGEQFKDTVKTLFPNWTCGWEDGKNSYDITLGTYSLMSKDNYSNKYFSSFGTIILDEYHRCGADTYSKILEKASCKNRISLTATPRRKDGLYKILQLHAGKVLEMDRNSQKATIYPVVTGAEINEELFRSVNRFSVKKENLEIYSDVAVRDIKTKKELDRGMVSDVCDTHFTLSSAITKSPLAYFFKDVNVFGLGAISSPMIDTEVAEFDSRNDIAFKIIQKCVSDGRKVIVLSKRKEQLFKLNGILNRRGIKSGVVVSESDTEYKKYCERCSRTLKENREYVFDKTQVILGIDKLAEEGMDAPSFDTLIYLHPVKDIEQSIGRILREFPNKKPPIAFYFLDKVNSYQKAFYNKTSGAKKMFESLGHKIESEITYNDLDNIVL